MKIRFRLAGRWPHLVVGLSLWGAGSMAMAHPARSGTEFVSGLLHPMTGLDHLLALITAGMLLGRHLRRPVPGVLLFVAAFGTGLVWASPGHAVPGIETALVATVPLAGLILWRVHRLPVPGLIGGLAMVAMLHGLAHGFEAPAILAFEWCSGALLTALLVTTLATAIGHVLRDRPAWLQHTGLGMFGTGMLMLGM